MQQGCLFFITISLSLVDVSLWAIWKMRFGLGGQ